MAFSRNVWRIWLSAALVVLATASEAALKPEPLSDTYLGLLSPPDLSSPRATLTTLRTSVQGAYDILDKAFDQYRADPGFFATPEVSKQIDDADLLLRRAVGTLDLSHIPAASRRQTGIETVLLIEEILDRLPPLDPALAPDAAAVSTDDVKVWELPHTDLKIVRVEDGSKAGKFIFSADSVADAPAIYATLQRYAKHSSTRSDLYRFYTLTPGDLLPPKWYFWIEKLPFWTQDSIFLGHALWQWVGILLTLVILFGGWAELVRIFRRRSAANSAGSRFWRRLIPAVLLIGVAGLARWVIVHQINASGVVLLVATIALEAIAYLAAAWVAYLVVAGVGEWITRSSRIDQTSVDASLIKVVARVAGIGAALVAIFIGATEVGLPLYGVIAGLGVGGLALGLAARPTLENLIGGFILYADRPVRVGDFCEFGDKIGTVEAIGLRSTHIRALDRTLITVPNGEFVNMELINHSRRDGTLLDTTIALSYETTPAQMEAILEGIRALLAGNPEVIQEGIRVRLVELAAYARRVEVRAHTKALHRSAFMEIQESILFGITRIIADAGAEIAIPSQVTYLVNEPPVTPPASVSSQPSQ